MLGFLWHLSNPWSALIVALVSMVIITYFKYVPADNQPLGNLGDIQGQTPFHEKKWISNFAKLPFGKTHYFLLGPEDGQKVVFVHGISCPGQCLPSFFNQLAAKGYRVLVYDHFGRGFSDSPGVFYSQDFYVSQLAMLLLSLGWTKTSIIGYSLGGAITAHFVAKFPHVIENVIFIAPTGLMTRLPRAAIVTKIPVLGPLFFFVFGRGVLKKISESNQTLKPTENEDLAHMIRLNSYMIQNHPGYLRAYFSTVIHFKFGGNDEYFSAIEHSHRNRSMAIWGTDDVVVPYEYAARLKELMPTLQLVSKPKWGHSIVAEDPKYCVDHIDRFLRSGKA